MRNTTFEILFWVMWAASVLAFVGEASSYAVVFAFWASLAKMGKKP